MVMYCFVLSQMVRPPSHAVATMRQFDTPDWIQGISNMISIYHYCTCATGIVLNIWFNRRVALNIGQVHIVLNPICIVILMTLVTQNIWKSVHSLFLARVFVRTYLSSSCG